MKLARDGVELSFDVAGMGSTQFLFVHGLGGDRTHFASQMEYFAGRGRTLNAELRGHGASDKPKQVYSIEGFAEDLVWLCARQQITQPVIVGQSMGAIWPSKSQPAIRIFQRAWCCSIPGCSSQPRQERCSPNIW